MAGKIFINYRRGDDPQAAGRLFDRLQDVFEPDQLFLDVDNIAPGLDFVRVLNERVAECDVMLAVIGKDWVDACDATGRRRLDDPNDFVRIEIESALSQDKRVIPVLVGEARMPSPEDLPEALKPMARRNAVRLTHERFRTDTQGLVKALQQTLEEIDGLRQAEKERARRLQVDAESKRQEYAASERIKAHDIAMATEDVAVLKSFIDSYPKGSDTNRVRARLRHLERPIKLPRALPQRIMIGALALALFAAVSLLLVKFRFLPQNYPQTTEMPTQSLTLGSEPRTQPPTLPLQSASAAQPEAQKPQPTGRPAPETTVASAASGTVSNPDEVAWLVLKDTTDDAALKRFIYLYPNSPLRSEAEARIAKLSSAKVAKTDAARNKVVSIPPATPVPVQPTTGAQPPTPQTKSRCDNFGGTWQWHSKFLKFDVVFNANGSLSATNGLTGTWSCTDGTFTISWIGGLADHLVLSADGKEMSGTSWAGNPVSGTRY
jgi:hypothetical protein